MGKALLIVNPYSGKKNGEIIAKDIREKLEAQSYTCTTHVSKSIVSLQQFISRTTLEDYTFIGLIGGDGTMHEFLNAALAKYQQILVPIALFPCGTGNAFNLDIGCTTIEETLRRIFENKTSFVDVAQVQYSNKTLWSFNILGCGLVAEINQLAERLRLFGAARYNIASVVKLLSNPIAHYSIKTDTKTFEGRYSFVLACNTRYTGKGMLMAPHAQLNDGKFDVTIVQACSALKLLMLFPKIFKGEHLTADILTYVQTSSLSVSSSKTKAATNIDGEIKGELPFSFTVHANKIKVFVG